MQKFYVYEWYNIDTNEVFYVGKGCEKRYLNIKNRNKLFLDYYENNNCDVRIVKFFENEEDAFLYESYLIDIYKNKGQAQCCIASGGYGGYSIVWTDELKKYWSENNPMKDEKQRQRMKDNNPMKNEDIAKKNGEKHKRPVIINNIKYNGLIDAAKALNVTTNTILNWCKRGYNTQGEPCRYADEEQKDFTKKTTCSKEVIVDGKLFPSVRAACDFLGIKDTSPMVRALKANRTYKGHNCKYANQQPS